MDTTIDVPTLTDNTTITIPEDREVVDDSGSLADHEAAYTAPTRRQADAPVRPSASDTEDEPAGTPEPVSRQRGRHRAFSQRATPEDVPQIQALTKELREAEEELKKLDPTVGTESPRVQRLKREIRAVKADLEQRRAPKAETPAQEPPRRTEVASPASAPPGEFAEAEPTLDEFPADRYADPYASYTRALAAWDRRKERHEEQQQRYQQWQAQAQQQQYQAEQQHAQQAMQAYHQRLSDYAQRTPGAVDRLRNVPPITAPLLQAAIVLDEQGPQVLDNLLQRPGVFLEAVEVARRSPDVTSDNVAYMRWWLQTKLADASQPRGWAGSTGAAPAPTVKSPPPPPTPVRTGASLTGSQPPGDDASLAEHESFYSRRRR